MWISSRWHWINLNNNEAVHILKLCRRNEKLANDILIDAVTAFTFNFIKPQNSNGYRGMEPNVRHRFFFFGFNKII